MLARQPVQTSFIYLMRKLSVTRFEHRKLASMEMEDRRPWRLIELTNCAMNTYVYIYICR